MQLCKRSQNIFMLVHAGAMAAGFEVRSCHS